MTISGPYEMDKKPYENPEVPAHLTVGQLRRILGFLHDESPVYFVEPHRGVACAVPCSAEIDDVGVLGPSITRRALLVHRAVINQDKQHENSNRDRDT